MTEPNPDFFGEDGRDEDRTILGNEAFEGVTRLVVVKDDVYTEYWAQAWRLSVQDGGKTVKLFAAGDAAEVISARNAALGDMLGVSAEVAAAFTQAVAESEGQPQRFR